MEVGLRTSRKLAGTSTESYGGARRISTRRMHETLFDCCREVFRDGVAKRLQTLV
jgi:hypothetical protein